MGGDLSLGRCVVQLGASSVGPSRGPPRTGHWASRGPRRKRRAPGPSPVHGTEVCVGWGTDLRGLGSPSRGSPVGDGVG